MNEEQLARKRELSRIWAAKWRAENPELARAKDRKKAKARRAKNGDALRTWERANYAANREKIRARTKEVYANNINGARDKALAYQHEKYATRNVMYRVRAAFHAAKLRARKRGLDFDLTMADLGTPTHCAATGIEFDMSCSFRQGNIFVPSLDRIDPKLGYVRGNVRFVCHGYNLAKHTGSDANVVKLARAIVAMADAH
jgi:hypothetical protein